MDESSVRDAMQRYWNYAGKDGDISHAMYHDDAVLEFPQSKERFEGKENFQIWREMYPADVDFQIRRIRGRGDFWVVECCIRYDSGPWHYGCSILEFRGDSITRETIYVGAGWEAPEWRAPWRAAWVEESVG
jgi:hypothetical protein